MQSLLTAQGIMMLVICIYAKHGKANNCDRKHVAITELRDIFIGRCVDFQTSLHPEYFCTAGLKNCTDLWVKFSTAFQNKPQCNVTADLYTDFIEAANHAVTGRQLFYSGVYDLAQRYSSRGTRFTTIENTLIENIRHFRSELEMPVVAKTDKLFRGAPDKKDRHLLDRVSFCGGSAGNSPSESCKKWDPVTCPNTASGSFWEAGSTNFAKNAVGDVYVLLNGTRNPIFRNNSYFTKYEVPNMRTGRVKKLTAILINETPTANRDLCKKDDSLKTLQDIVQAKDIEFVCTENPRDLVYIFCMDSSRTDLCKNVNILYPIGKASTLRGSFCPQSLFLFLALLNILN